MSSELADFGKYISLAYFYGRNASERKKINLWHLLFSNKRWANCPDGYFMRGLYRGDGQRLHHIEEGSCCRPNNLPNRYLDCYEKDVEKTFDKKGWGKCSNGYYMAGFYKGTCDKVYCIEKFRCCSMSDDGCTMADWWSAFDNKGSVECSSSTQYITGLWRNKQANDDKIYLLEEAKCCPAPAPNKHTPSTCQKANWWKILDG